MAVNGNYVLIHDCARPMVTGEVIAAVAEAAVNFGGAVCGVPVKDTVKEVCNDGFVGKTLDRSRLISVQTPQGFKTDLLKEAYAKLTNPENFTDDSSVMEAAGYRVKTVMGDYTNIKITTPEDLPAAERFIRSE